MSRIAVVTLLTSVLLSAGCESGSSSGPAPIQFANAAPAPGFGFVAMYAPPVDVGPYPNDIYNLPGQTLSVPQKITSPLASSLNTLDGFSTTAKITQPFNAPVDAATLIPFNPLAMPTGTESIFVLNATTGLPLVPGLHYTVRISSAAAGGAIVEFVPLRPLAPESTYVFILTNGIRSTGGVAAGADTVFGLVRDAHLASVMTGNPALDALLPAIGPLIDAGLALGLAGDSIVSAWSVSTQSISNVLETIEASATARLAAVIPTGLTTADLGLGLPGIADLYVGFIEVPYYGDRNDPLGSVWVNNALEPPTRGNPTPIAQSGALRIPILAALPNAFSLKTKPPGGWPMVIMQHGVTRNRMDMVAMADAFAQAGFGVIAIDLPLHGITDINNPFYQAPGNPLGTTERHFNFDNVGPLGDYTPDGLIDDGWQIFNVANPLNARDHARQAVADLIHLARTLPTLNFDADPAADVDAASIHFVGVSLGSLISAPFLGINNDVGTATLSSPGGLYADFLYDPNATQFGLPIRTAIEAQGLRFGSVAFDNFARDLQTLLDPIEPINYGEAAAGIHPLHVIAVLSDGHVPIGLTDRLAAEMGLSAVSMTTMNAGGVSGIVRFTAGAHTSILDPSAGFAVTAEMQAETVTFAASGGTVIQVSNTSIVQ